MIAHAWSGEVVVEPVAPLSSAHRAMALEMLRKQLIVEILRGRKNLFDTRHHPAITAFSILSNRLPASADIVNAMTDMRTNRFGRAPISESPVSPPSPQTVAPGVTDEPPAFVPPSPTAAHGHALGASPALPTSPTGALAPGRAQMASQSPRAPSRTLGARTAALVGPAATDADHTRSRALGLAADYLVWTAQNARASGATITRPSDFARFFPGHERLNYFDEADAARVRLATSMVNELARDPHFVSNVLPEMLADLERVDAEVVGEVFARAGAELPENFAKLAAPERAWATRTYLLTSLRPSSPAAPSLWRLPDTSSERGRDIREGSDAIFGSQGPFLLTLIGVSTTKAPDYDAILDARQQAMGAAWESTLRRHGYL